MRNFHHLTAWQRAHALALVICRLTLRHHGRGVPGLLGQLRRAAMSIPTNITEGCGQDGWREYARYLGVAVGSAVELEYLLIFARDLGELPAAKADALIAETVATRRMVHALRARIVAVHEGAGASVTRH